MKKRLRSFLTCLGSLALALSFSVFISCKDVGPKRDHTGITTPSNGAAITSLPLISGWFDAGTYYGTGAPYAVEVKILRYSDGAYWNGSSWGGGNPVLTPVINRTTKTWEITSGLPAAADLSDGFYAITAFVDYHDVDSETSVAVVTVGTTAPPVRPAVYAWGDNSSGQLGTQNPIPNAYEPVPIFMRGSLDGKLIANLISNGKQSFALTDSGVYSWGDDSHGQLGQGTHAGTFVAQPAPVFSSGAMSGENIQALAAGFSHTVALSEAGWLYAWGSNDQGEIGNNTFAADQKFYYPQPVDQSGALAGKTVIAIAAGNDFSMALTSDGSDGKVFTWGMNDYGQLGDGTTTRRTAPVEVQGLLAGKKVIAITAGDEHALALTQEGEVYTWGWSLDSMGLGPSHAGIETTPVRVLGALAGQQIVEIRSGYGHNLALGADGVVYAWGSDYDDQLGNGTDAQTYFPIALGGGLTGKTVTQIFTGTGFNMAVTADQEVYGWGSNHYGELTDQFPVHIIFDDGPTEPTLLTKLGNALSGGRVVYDIALAERHALMLTGFDPTLQPEIEVEAQDAALVDGGSMNCGTFGIGSSNPIFVTVRNSGKSVLTGLSADIDGPDAFEFFTVLSHPGLLPNDTTGFYVFFKPNSLGALNATLHIHSNDLDESSFDVALTGTSYPVGQVDLPFDPGVTGDVQSVSVQPDGNIIIGGSFVSVAGPTARNYCARLQATSGLADSFNPDLGTFTYCSAVLPDGKVMIGGQFDTVGGVTRKRLARLNFDGTLDTSYDAQLSTGGTVFGMALQADGKLIIVGNFTSVATSSSPYIARLNPDGTLDGSFVTGLSSPPRGVAVRADGQVLIYGGFSGVSGTPMSKIALLNGADGSLDTTFANPLIVTKFGSSIEAAALQRDGKVIVGGNLATVDGATRNGMCRLNTDGTLDAGFDPDVNDLVRSIALQADGSMIICGQFTSVSGQTRNRIAKIKSNGALDFYFDPNCNGAMKAVTLQADGKVLCTPFTNIAGVARANFARLTNDIATQTLKLDNGAIVWERGGSSPETNLVTFEVSGDGGGTWTDLGPAMRVIFPNPGWQMFGATLPPTGHIRARAYPQGAYYNGSVSQMITTVAYGTPPEIEVSENAVPFPQSSAKRDFGVVATGSAASTAILTIQNTGGTTLTGFGGATINGAAASNFELGRPASSSLAPGATATMTVTYRPKTTGTHVVYLSLPNNSWYLSNYQIMLKGIGSLPFTTYKQQKTGDSASPDTADTDGNGQSDLQEYATGTTTTSTDGDGTSISPPSGGSGFAAFANGETNDAPPPATFLFNYRRNKLSLADIIFQVEWSDTLAENDWHTTDVTEEIISDDDSIQQVQATVPAGTGGRRFVRLKMTRP